MGPYYACCGYDLHLERSVVDFFSILIEVLWYCMRLFLLRWGPFVHSLGIVQSNFTRRDHPGNPGGVSGSGPVILCPRDLLNIILKFTCKVERS